MNQPNRTLIYRVSRSGHVIGEYDIDRIVELLDSGEFLWTDLCWAQGMAAWAPLSNLRSEVAAVKAFPAAAAMPTPVASGRRRMQAPAAQTAAPQVSASGIAGWMWIVGGVTLGALVGLLTTHLFPNVVQVDRPVEKIVEKPVEVIRTVEKIVDRKISLTDEQAEGLVLAARINDPTERKIGVRLFKLSNRVKVLYGVEGKGRSNVDSGTIVARVESAFRGHGFTVLPKDSKESPYSVVKVGGLFLETTASNGSVLSISGSYSVTIAQPLLALNPFDNSKAEFRTIKVGMVDLYTREGAIDYGANNFYKVPDVFARAAETCAEDLRKAQDE
jgi:hypothetical protein